MVWMEPAALASSVSPVFNDLDLLVVAYDGTSETTFYPNSLTTKDEVNTVEMISISAVDSYDWFNVSREPLLSHLFFGAGVVEQANKPPTSPVEHKVLRVRLCHELTGWAPSMYIQDSLAPAYIERL